MSLRLNKSHKEEIARKARALSPIHKQIKELLQELYTLSWCTKKKLPPLINL